MATYTGAATADKNSLLILAAAALLLLIAAAGFVSYQSSVAQKQIQLGSSQNLLDTLRVLSKTGADTAQGVAPDFKLLQSLGAGFDTLLSNDRGGGPEFDALAIAWAPVQTALKTMADNAVPYGRVSTNAKVIADVLPPAINAYAESFDKLSLGGSAGDTYLLGRQLFRVQRILQTAQQTLSTGSAAEAKAQVLSTDVVELLRDHKVLATNGVIDRATAKYISDAFATVETAAAAIAQDIKPVAVLQVAAGSLPSFIAPAITNAESLRQKMQSSLSVANTITTLCALAAVLGLGLVGLYVSLTISQNRRRKIEAKAQDAQQQQAILSLLDEITNLANGDLTGELTVTADFTGNIADSLNYTVQTLRGLVGTINDTSVEIAAAASSTTDRVEQMSAASEGQAREIVRATQSISRASRSLEEVAGRAELLAEQAKGSVDTAHSGAATVDRTIAGMSTLREQIQDTAKRIKRLGESSQEIGNIIEFINDIAEQTNTLALNASIQAAMAGESGRGFAVVADEVQRLAERAASATKQIESLVKAIQADTQEAITSMERSTANVVGGAKNAEEAGLALTRIEASSQELARVMQDIASASRTQSVETTKLAAVMQSIREVSVQTSTSAHQTADSVGQLNTLSAKLRESVAGFKLPVDGRSQI